MGRGKIEIKKIENANSRQVTFSKRRAGLLKKAKELAILCDAEVAVIIFSSTGKLFEFSNCGMRRTIVRYKKCLDSAESSLEDPNTEKENFNEVEILKDEIARLQLKQWRLLGKELTDLSLKELHHLEQQLNEGLFYVQRRKEQLLMEQLEQSRLQEQRALLENETLRRQVEEFRDLFPSTSCSMPSREKFNLERKNYFKSPDSCSVGKGDSDTTLHLGLPSDVHQKRKAAESSSNNSGS